MARVYEEVVVIKLSKLVRGSDAQRPLVDDVNMTTLEQVIAEVLADPAVIVEVERME